MPPPGKGAYWMGCTERAFTALPEPPGMTRALSPLFVCAAFLKSSSLMVALPSRNMNQPLRPPFSQNFFELSQAPPVLDMDIANCTDEDMAPARRPTTASTPKMEPTKMGDRSTSAAGAIISVREACVAMEMQAV